MWPRDLLGERIPQARIMTWGYDSDPIHFFKRQGQQSILSHAQDLLADVQLERESESERTRPIIFVGHSLGGLVIKQALIKATEYNGQRRYARQSAVRKYCTGIVFIGTPHRGADMAAWATTAARLVKAIGKSADEGIVASLTSGSSVLESLQDSFAGIQSCFNIHTVLEGQAMPGIGKIVENYHARLDCENETCLSIAADHRNMCKFSHNKEPGFRRIAGALKEQIEDADNVLATNCLLPSSTPNVVEPLVDEQSELIPNLPEHYSDIPVPTPAIFQISDYEILYESLLDPILQYDGASTPSFDVTTRTEFIDICKLKRDGVSPLVDNNKMLYMAVLADRQDIISRCIEAGVNLNHVFVLSTDAAVTEKKKGHSLLKALQLNRTACVEMLYNAGASLHDQEYAVRRRRYTWDTTVMDSLLRNISTATLKVVIKYQGIEVFPLEVIYIVLVKYRRNDPELLETLIRAGFPLGNVELYIPVTERNWRFGLFIHYAVAYNTAEIVEVFLRHCKGSDQNEIKPDAWESERYQTLLHTLIIFRVQDSLEENLRIAKLLIDNGVRIDAKYIRRMEQTSRWSKPKHFEYTTLDLAKRYSPDLVPFLEKSMGITKEISARNDEHSSEKKKDSCVLF